MDNLNINTGLKRVSINSDPERVIEFNPSDVAFAERFYKLLKDFEAKQVEYQARAEQLDSQAVDLDEYGVPVNAGEKLSFLREVCEFMYQKIDYLFGVGASTKIFGGSLNIDAIGQFFDGIVPFVQVQRAAKVSKYANLPKSKRVMK